MSEEKHRILVVKLPFDVYLDVSVAAEVLRERSISAMLYTQVLRKIREAQQEASPTEWAEHQAVHKKRILERGESRREAYKRKEASKGKGVPSKTIQLKQPQTKRRQG